MPTTINAVRTTRLSTPNGTSVLRRDAKPLFAGDTAELKAAFDEFTEAFEKKDIDTVESMFSAQAKKERPLGSREDIVALMESYRFVVYRITSVRVDGNNGTVDYEDSIVGREVTSPVTSLLSQHETWVNEGGEWKFTADVASPVGIPADLRSVHVALRDDSQVVIIDPIPKGELAFTIENRGAAKKGLFLVAIPSDLDVPTYIAERSKGGQLRDDVVELGATADVPAHSSGAMVFNAALPTGRYLLLSVTPDRQQLLTREYAEFAIG